MEQCPTRLTRGLASMFSLSSHSSLSVYRALPVMASMDPLLICCLMAHNSRKNGSPTVSCEQGVRRGQDLISTLSLCVPTSKLWPAGGPHTPLLKMLRPAPPSRVSPLHPSHVPRDQPSSVGLREGKHPAL